MKCLGRSLTTLISANIAPEGLSFYLDTFVSQEAVRSVNIYTSDFPLFWVIWEKVYTPRRDYVVKRIQQDARKLRVGFKPKHKSQFRAYYFRLFRQTLFENFPVKSSLIFNLFNGGLAIDLPDLELRRGLIDALGR